MFEADQRSWSFGSTLFQCGESAALDVSGCRLRDSPTVWQ
jgi:hypothetical protein